MQNQDDDFDKDEDFEAPAKISRKKILFILIPLLMAVGIAVGFYYVFNRNYDNDASLNYSVVKNTASENGTDAETVTVFYDLPEISARLQNPAGEVQTLNFKLSIELSKVEDTQTVDNLLPRIKDAINAHIVELTPEEVRGSEGLYWLKEELLYRINLLTAPVKVNNLNFKSFDFQGANEIKG